jgi:hypothetical protein
MPCLRTKLASGMGETFGRRDSTGHGENKFLQASRNPTALARSLWRTAGEFEFITWLW